MDCSDNFMLSNKSAGTGPLCSCFLFDARLRGIRGLCGGGVRVLCVFVIQQMHMPAYCVSRLLIWMQASKGCVQYVHFCPCCTRMGHPLCMSDDALVRFHSLNFCPLTHTNTDCHSHELSDVHVGGRKCSSLRQKTSDSLMFISRMLLLIKKKQNREPLQGHNVMGE